MSNAEPQLQAARQEALSVAAAAESALRSFGAFALAAAVGLILSSGTVALPDAMGVALGPAFVSAAAEYFFPDKTGALTVWFSALIGFAFAFTA